MYHFYGTKCIQISILTVILIGLSAQLFAQNANRVDQVTVVNTDKIEAQLSNTGKVGLIVQFDINFTAEKRMSKTQVDNQREVIRQTGENLIQDLSPFQATNIKEFSTLPFLAVRVDEQGYEHLKTHPSIKTIEYDKIMSPLLDRSTEITGAAGTGGAWQLGYDGSGQTIVILDSGVNLNHSFLQGKIVAEACFNTTSAEHFSESLCPNGLDEDIGPGSGEDCGGVSDIGDIDGCGHGTHVAGIAAGANGDADGTEIDGVAKGANIISINVFSKFNDDEDCGGSAGDAPCIKSFTSDIVSAIDHVYNNLLGHEIAAVNMSLGGDQHFSTCDVESPSLKTSIDNLRSENIASIVASGNNGWSDSMAFPACISSAVSVASTRKFNPGDEENESLDNSSNTADFLDLIAPGRGDSFGEGILSSDLNGSYTEKGGTSMAAPHVAGAWAILRQAFTGSTVPENLQRLTDTGVMVSDNRNGLEFPRIQINDAISEEFIFPEIVVDFNASPITIPQSSTATAQLTITNNAEQNSDGEGVLEFSFAETLPDNSSFIALNSHEFEGDTSILMEVDPQWGMLISITANFEKISGSASVEDLALLVVEGDDVQAGTLRVQVGGSDFNADEFHPWPTPDGNLITGEITLNNAWNTENFTYWLVNTGDDSGQSSTWDGEIGLVYKSFLSSASPLSGFIDPQASVNVDLTFNAGDFSGGTYSDRFIIESNATNTPSYFETYMADVSGGFVKSYSQGWNIVGMPTDAPDKDYTSLFSNSSSLLFEFDGSFNNVSELELGKGYWLKFAEGGEGSFLGESISPLDINLRQGWNLISGNLNIIQVSSIEDPDNIISSLFWEFNGSLNTVEELHPGNGYWVKANQVGTITIPAISSKQLALKNSNPLKAAGLTNFSKVNLYSGNNKFIQLYFDGNLNDGFHKDLFEMPSKPPGETLDARLSENYLLSEQSSITIQINKIDDPISLMLESGNNESNDTYHIVEYYGDVELSNQNVEAEKKFQLHPDTDRIILETAEDFMADLPDDFSLGQNYPNPFNPTTTITYALPQQSDVRLDVYNITGRRVATLVESTQQTGNHTVSFDASGFASGIYIYRLTADNYQQTRKMILVK